MAEARRLEIVIHADLNGREPFSNWHGRLKDHQGHAVITSKINSLALGNFGNSKALGDGLYELRIHFGPGYRVYFGMRGSNR